MANETKIQVRIEGWRRIQFGQIVKMTPAEYEKLRSLADSDDDRALTEKLDELIDLTTPCDAELFEDVEIEKV